LHSRGAGGALAIAAAALLTLAPQELALGQALPPGSLPSRGVGVPAVRYQATFDVSSAPPEFDPYQAVWDFAPGTWTPLHYHTGPVFVATLEGVVTFHHVAGMGPDAQVRSGDAYVETPNMVHAAGNTTTVPARQLVTNLVPRGAEQSYAVPDDRPAPPPPATRTYNAKFEIPLPQGPFRLTEAVLDFPPQTAGPLVPASGPTLHTVLDGTVTVQVDAATTTYAAGQTWTVLAGQREQLGNPGAAAASVYVTALLPGGTGPGAGLPAALAQPPTLPRTGAGSGSGWSAAPDWRVLACITLASGMIWLGCVHLRRHERPSRGWPRRAG
jgi:quercetin dioxygenase-like cupin family protein